MRREDPYAGREEVEALLADPAGLTVVYQPICDLRTGRAVGYEALSRFPGRGHRTVPEWFDLARRVGLGDALEARAVAEALPVVLEPGQYLAINLSPRALRAEQVRAVLDRDLTDVVVEVTEESDLATDDMVDATDWLRVRGARIAMDDTGEGFAGLRRLVHLRPDLVKLDRTLVSDVHQHPDKAALVEALVAFCRRTGAELCAEGVETGEELWALRDLHVTLCQGWLAGRPSPVPAPPHHSFVAACHGVRTVRGDVGPAVQMLAAATTGYDLDQALDEAIVALDVDGVAWSQVRGDLLVSLRSLDDVPAGTYRITDYPATQAALTTGLVVPVDVDDPAADHQEARLLLEVGYHGVLLVPVPGPDGRSASLLELYSRRRRTWQRDDLALVQTLVDALAQAVASAPESRRS
jgi:EAL domain-containing protein (putative c-di-GMP-specific phosphodiesterase class I)